LDGVTETGVSLIQMDAKMDAGPIVAQTSIPMPADATSASLLDQLARLGSQMLIDTLPQFATGTITPKPQNETNAMTIKMMAKQDGFISTDELLTIDRTLFDRKVRAYFPWPTVWTTWHGKTIKFLPNQLIQLEGKAPISVKQFSNGYPDAALWIDQLFT